jgi:amino acid adenylation domain-containing protein
VTPRLLHELVADSARRAPDAPAIVDGDRTFSYGELDGWSNAIARVLVAQGVTPGDRVAIHLDKSAEAVAAIHGTLKAGAAYVPFDPTSPDARLAYVAANAGIRVACTSAKKLASLGAMRALGAPLETAVVLDADPDAAAGGESRPPRVVGASEVAGASREPFAVRRIPEDLAYVLYTSGSTGNPKGVMLSHRAALGFVTWAVEAIGVTAADRCSSHAPFHFDLSIFDLYASALAGAAVVLVPATTSRFPVEVRRFIEREHITIWYSVPSILSLLARRGGLTEGALPELRVILFAGEVFPTNQRRELMRLLPHVTYWNLYGPTETNVCTAYRVPPLDAGGDAPLPIGRAVDGDETFVVTEDGRLAAPGEAGVLYVRGATVMSGYWNDPERTDAVLAPSPFHAPLRDLAYCTGDLVRERTDGNYDFLGRRDLQIKSRGYRIELGEIEAALGALDSVVETAVVAVPDEMVGNRIHAFAAVRAGTPERALVDACKARLPGYMVPERLELLDALPKTSTGKIDRRALSERAAEHWTHATTGGTRP